MDMKRFFLYAIAIAALALAGCGGNGGGIGRLLTTAPATATATDLMVSAPRAKRVPTLSVRLLHRLLRQPVTLAVRD